MIPIPDLLNREPFLGIDREALTDLLGLAILGREIGTEFHDLMAEAETPPTTWRPEFFEQDLFIDRLIAESFEIAMDGVRYPINERFLRGALSATPTDLQTIEFRQSILREMDENEEILASARRLYRELFALLSLHRTPRYHRIVDHEGAAAIHETEEYKTLAALLDYEDQLAQLNLDIALGGDGRIRRVDVRSLDECSDNPFWTRPIKRFLDRLRLGIGGYSMTNRELLNRVIERVYVSLSPALIPLIQMLGQLELYLAVRALRDRAAGRGLAMCIPEILPDHDTGPGFVCEDLWNLLLLHQEQAPVPCTVSTTGSVPITVVTGPNSGGKTRSCASAPCSRRWSTARWSFWTNSARAPTRRRASRSSPWSCSSSGASIRWPT
ncbi:MAG: hypothetical protein OXU63_13070 [Acidobacteriota bacterium]|nr:hypothetical protein [Acidobacteriota bacterium]